MVKLIFQFYKIVWNVFFFCFLVSSFSSSWINRILINRIYIHRYIKCNMQLNNSKYNLKIIMYAIYLNEVMGHNGSRSERSISL